MSMTISTSVSLWNCQLLVSNILRSVPLWPFNERFQSGFHPCFSTEADTILFFSRMKTTITLPNPVVTPLPSPSLASLEHLTLLTFLCFSRFQPCTPLLHLTGGSSGFLPDSSPSADFKLCAHPRLCLGPCYSLLTVFLGNHTHPTV